MMFVKPVVVALAIGSVWGQNAAAVRAAADPAAAADRLLHEARVAFNRKDFVAASRKLELLDALFDANWTLQGGDQPDLRWRELTLMHLRFEPERALKVASRITDPYVLASMRVDQRFASLWSATSGRLGTCMSIFVR
jgi:hypothetical protein